MNEAFKTQFANHLENPYFSAMACSLLRTSPKGLTCTQLHADCVHVFGMCSKKKTWLQSASVQLESDDTSTEKIKNGPKDK